jgi:hypothetical protein
MHSNLPLNRKSSAFLAGLVLLSSIKAISAPPVELPERSEGRIVSMELDDRTVYRIPVSPLTVTTISFPSPIEGLEGRNIAMNGSDLPFFLSYTSGNYYFSVTANQPNVRTNLNVLWNDKTYVLELVAANSPALSVVFTLPRPHRRQAQVLPTRLLGILDTVKAFPLLRTNFPREFGSVEVVSPNKVSDFGKFSVTTEKIYRFNQEDTLVFDLTLANNTDGEILYQPQGFATRVANNVYYQSISDASGRIPPHGKEDAYFAITGTPDGGRNDLSLQNDFTVLVTELEGTPSSPTRQQRPQELSPHQPPKPAATPKATPKPGGGKGPALP